MAIQRIHVANKLKSVPDTFQEWVREGFCDHYLCFEFSRNLKLGMDVHAAHRAASKKVLS